jgi:hypothetical protein
MKKIIMAFSIVLAGVFSVHAQEHTASQSPAGKIVDKIDVICRLTPEQKEKVRPIAQAFTSAKMDNKKKYADDTEGLKAANKASGENFKAQLKAILTTDQYAAFEQSVKEKQEKTEATKK